MGVIFAAEFSSADEIDNWEIITGDAARAVIADGKLNLGSTLNNYGNDLTLISKILLPYVETSTYMFETSVIGLLADSLGSYGRIAAGFIGVAADGFTLVGWQGQPALTEFYYHAIDFEILTADEAVYYGYTRGYSGDMSPSPGVEEDFPAPVAATIKYFRPLIYALRNNAVTLPEFAKAAVQGVNYFRIYETALVAGESSGASVYSVTPNKAIVIRRSSVTFDVYASYFTDGMLFWEVVSVSGSVVADDFYQVAYDPATTSIINGTVSIIAGVGQFDLMPMATTDKSFQIRLRTGSFTGAIVATSAVVAIDPNYVSLTLTPFPNTPTLRIGSEVFFSVKANIDWRKPIYWKATTFYNTTTDTVFQDFFGEIYLTDKIGSFSFTPTSLSPPSGEQEGLQVIVTNDSSFFNDRVTIERGLKSYYSYRLSSYYEGANEGGSIQIQIDAPNIQEGTVMPFIITGIQLEDISSMSISYPGSTTPTTIATTLTPSIARGSDYYCYLNIFLVDDSISEGVETLTLTMHDPLGVLYLPSPAPSISLEIADSSLGRVYSSEPYPCTLTYSFLSDTLNESDQRYLFVYLSMPTAPIGTSIPFTLTGISLDDLQYVYLNQNYSDNSPKLNGAFTISGATYSYATFVIKTDYLTEGTEYFTLTLDPPYSTPPIIVPITDTSIGTGIPVRAYSSSPYPCTISYEILGSTELDEVEHDLLRIKIDAPTAPIGTLIPYSITGVSVDDLKMVVNDAHPSSTVPLLSDNFYINEYFSSILIWIKADNLTEGTERLTLRLAPPYFSEPLIIEIKDTSTGLGSVRAYSPDPYPCELTYKILNSDMLNETDSTLLHVTLNMPTAPLGTVIPYTITGVSVDDFDFITNTKNPAGALSVLLTDSFVISGLDRLFIKIRQDMLTEGAEYFTITLDPPYTLPPLVVQITDTSLGSGTGTPINLPPATITPDRWGLELYAANGKKTLDLSNKAALLYTYGTVTIAAADWDIATYNHVDVSIPGIADNGTWEVALSNQVCNDYYQTWAEIHSGFVRFVFHSDNIYEEDVPSSVTCIYSVFRF